MMGECLMPLTTRIYANLLSEFNLSGACAFICINIFEFSVTLDYKARDLFSHSLCFHV